MSGEPGRADGGAPSGGTGQRQGGGDRPLTSAVTTLMGRRRKGARARRRRRNGVMTATGRTGHVLAQSPVLRADTGNHVDRHRRATDHHCSPPFVVSDSGATHMSVLLPGQ